MKLPKISAVVLLLSLVAWPGPHGWADETSAGQDDQGAWSPWLVDTERAKAEAARAGYAVVYYFHREGSDACAKFEEKVLLQQLLPLLASSVVMVKVDVVTRSRFAQSLRVTHTPAMVFVSSKGEELARTTGFVTAREVLAALKAAVDKEGPPITMRRMEEAGVALREGQFARVVALAEAAREASRSPVLARHAAGLKEAVGRIGKSLVELGRHFESGQRWYEGSRIYTEVMAGFAGLPAGREAQRALARLQADPGISVELRKRSVLESKARRYYQEAALALARGEVQEARELFEKVGTDCPGTTFALAAENQLREMQIAESTAREKRDADGRQ